MPSPKEPLLLLHGALGSKAQLSPLKTELAAHFSVHSLDFEGHGRRPSDRNFSMDHFGENVTNYMDQTGIPSAYIFGYSMGGYAALNLATANSNRIKGIVTFGTKFDWTPESAKKEVKMLNPEAIEQKVPKFAAHLKKLHPGNDWKEVLRKTAGLMLDLGAEAPLHRESLSKIEIPVHILIGDADAMVSIEESKFASDHLPQGHLHILEGFQHPLEKNDSKLLADEIVRKIFGSE